MNVNERIRMARLLNHISHQPEYAKKIGIVLENDKREPIIMRVSYGKDDDDTLEYLEEAL